MMMNHDLRGNAYARLDRDASGEVISMWPMPADQVETRVLADGSMIYVYSLPMMSRFWPQKTCCT